MCPLELKRQDDLSDHSTPLSTKAHLLVLKCIITNIEVEMPASNKKAKMADSKTKTRSISSRIPKKACKIMVNWDKKHSGLCKKHGDVHTMYNIFSVIGTTPTGHTQNPVAWIGIFRQTAAHRVQMFCSLFMQSARKLFVPSSKGCMR